MSNKKTNVQFYPVKQRIVPNFKLAKVMNNLSQEKYDRMVIDGNSRKIVEKKNHKKHGDVITTYKISNADGYDNTDPLTEFDRAILSVCASNWDEGNYFVTPAVILRGLTGKIGIGGNGKIHKEQRIAIMNSIIKLMSTIIWIDDSDVNEQLNYADTNNSKKCSAILPAYFVEKTINGQEATIIYFDRESPLMEMARARKQLLTYDVSLLDVPNQNNTSMNITIKNYAMNRIQEIKLHKLNPILTFADVFKKCRIDNASADTKMNARNVLIKFFEHLKSKGEITDFTVTKQRNSFYSIKFSYPPKSAQSRRSNQSTKMRINENGVTICYGDLAILLW